MLKVLFVTGATRSGTTLLDRLLGTLPGFWSTGELLPHLDQFLEERVRCGCGCIASQCSFWGEIRREFLRNIPLDQIRDFVRDFTPSRLTGKIRLKGLTLNERMIREIRYANLVTTLYSLIFEKSRINVLVDSSKSPFFAEFLAGIPQLDLYVIHVVRDPRGVAYSWSRKKFDELAGRYMQRKSVLSSAVHWVRYNRGAEKLKAILGQRMVFVKYEDLAFRWNIVLESALKDLGLHTSVRTAYQPDAVLPNEGVVLGVAHTAGGNPSRAKTGHISIRLDTDWKHHFPLWKQLCVVAIAGPLMYRYGYVTSPRLLGFGSIPRSAKGEGQ